MLYMLITSVLSIIIGCVVVWWSYKNNFLLDWLAALLGGVLALIGGIGLVAIIIMAVDYHGAKVKAKLINREYGTDYTQEEVFYASSVINTIRELDRKRVEINGNLFRGKPEQE